MINCIIGESSSGKSTIENELYKLGLDKITSFTTRPRRDGEIHGLDYYFISSYEFHLMIDNGLFSEYAQYRDWLYGLSLTDVDYENMDYVVVVTFRGLKTLVDTIGSEYIRSFYIEVPERERIIRQLNRGDDVDEVFRRLKTDRKDFKKAKEYVDHIILNNDIDKSTKEIYNIIVDEKPNKIL